MLNYKPIRQRIDSGEPYHTDVLRLDLVDEEVSGNKWFKLKYNLEKAKEQGQTKIITFGGAYSNHIAAAAGAICKAGFNSIGIIRGEEGPELNPTLLRARENGMRLHFISRDLYSKKNSAAFKEFLLKEFGEHYLIPEGGNNLEGARGCSEILQPDWEYDWIACACGTATTFAGLTASLKDRQITIGISVLRGTNSLPAEAMRLIKEIGNGEKKIAGNEALDNVNITRSLITDAYSFSGYARYDQELVEFKHRFEQQHGIPLDHVYTAKLFYAVTDLTRKRKLKEGTRGLIIHSGGLQGNAGFEARYHLKPMR